MLRVTTILCVSVSILTLGADQLSGQEGVDFTIGCPNSARVINQGPCEPTEASGCFPPPFPAMTIGNNGTQVPVGSIYRVKKTNYIARDDTPYHNGWPGHYTLTATDCFDYTYFSAPGCDEDDRIPVVTQMLDRGDHWWAVPCPTVAPTPRPPKVAANPPASN